MTDPTKDWRACLDPLFNPASIAVVGVSGGSKLGMGANAVKNLLAFGYQGRIYPVNPKYDQIQGLRCYPRIAEIPDRLDCVLIAIPALAIHGVFRNRIESIAAEAALQSEMVLVEIKSSIDSEPKAGPAAGEI